MVADRASLLARVRHMFGVKLAQTGRFSLQVVLVSFARRVVQAQLLAGLLAWRASRRAAGAAPTRRLWLRSPRDALATPIAGEKKRLCAY